MALKKILSPVSDVLDKVCSVAIVIMLGLMVVITTAQIAVAEHEARDLPVQLFDGVDAQAFRKCAA